MNLQLAHLEYVRRASLIDRMLYELDQCNLSSPELEKAYAENMDRARDIRLYLKHRGTLQTAVR